MIPLKDNIPTERFPWVTITFIVVNVFVFLFLQGPSFSEEQVKDKPLVEYGLIAHRLTHPDDECTLGVIETQYTATKQVVCEGTSDYGKATDKQEVNDAPPFVTLFTSMFMHGGWLHIIFNMLFLWIFGNNIEDSMGRVRYMAFYLAGGIAAGLSQVAADPSATDPAIGASGAVAAVLGGYALLYRRAGVLTLVFIPPFVTLVTVPALFMLALWFILQFVPAIGQLADPDLGGGIAYFAHVGGFVFGLALIKVFAERRNPYYENPPYPVY